MNEGEFLLLLMGGLGTAASVWLLSASRSFGDAIGLRMARDVSVCCRMLAETMIRIASRRMPRSHRARYRDEWLAELDALRREHDNALTFSLVVFALRILVRARRTGRAVSKALRTEAPASRFVDTEVNPYASIYQEIMASWDEDLFLDESQLTWARDTRRLLFREYIEAFYGGQRTNVEADRLLDLIQRLRSKRQDE